MIVDPLRPGQLARRRTRPARRRRAGLLSVLLLTALTFPAPTAAALHLPAPTRTTSSHTSLAPPTATTAGARTDRGPDPSASDSTPAPGEGVWPLSPEPGVVFAFDPPTSRWGPGHRGVDLAGSVGQPVRAAQAGSVSFAGRIAGRGVVVVTHGAVRTTYEPVAATVAVGDEVGAGDPIGRLELLGSHCLPRACLHWGLLRGATYLDPLTLVGAGPVRLLPWSGTTPLRR